jgi:tRNA threonylcarbamoyladenosine dehydratase
MEYINKRFSGLNKLYSPQSNQSPQSLDVLEILKNKKICIIGVGGVGSWVAEFLARSAIGSITLIDFDNISLSNANRQVHACDENYGKSKVQAMKQRIYSINKQCKVNVIEEFISAENIYILNGFDYIIDACDDIKAKISIAQYCLQKKIKIIVCGAAGGKIDPCKLKIDKLHNVIQDPILAKIRYSLRKNYGYTEKINLQCVYSSEQVKKPVQKSCITGGLSCDGYGSSVCITSGMACILAQTVLNILMK